MVAILIMSAKLATLDLLKIKAFRNKGYEVIISVHYVTSKTLSRELTDIVDVVMLSKLGNSSIALREPQFFKDLIRETIFLRSAGSTNRFKFNNLGWH